MRIIIYTGKGGVGKTSVAAATAIRLAKQGMRTIIMSTDAAHSLADSLDASLGGEPTQVAERLWAQEVDSVRQTEKHWGAVQSWLTGFMGWAKLDDMATEEMLVFPGMEELFSLMEMKRHATSRDYDAVVVDCAPTGETLRLLSYPSVLGWWVNKVFPFERRLVKLARPVAKVMAGGLELPDENVMNSVESFIRELEHLQTWIMNRDITSVRIVVNPEKMVISEARRAFTYFNLYGFNTDAIVINRVLPPEAESGYWANWHRIHEKYEKEIRDSFSPLPMFRIPLMESEVVGLPMLDRLGESAFEGTDLSAVLHRDQTQTVRKDGECYVMELALPFVGKEQLQLHQRGDELTVQAGSFKRKLFLPKPLLGRPIAGAKFVEGKLVIRFGDREKKSDEGRRD